MILIRKLAPKRLAKAIVALAVRSGNKLMRTRNKTPDVIGGSGLSVPAGGGGHLKQSKRTTITVTTETERLLIVNRSSLAPDEPAECQNRER